MTLASVQRLLETLNNTMRRQAMKQQRYYYSYQVGSHDFMLGAALAYCESHSS